MYPAAEVEMRPASVLRSCETLSWTIVLAVLGGSSAHRASISRSTET